jgi:O-antigen/teichoic acid export membrane protein
MRFDYVVSRDIVDEPAFDVARKIRDQAVFYGLNYLTLALVLTLIVTADPLQNVSGEIVFFAFVLSLLESFAAITSGNVVALGNPVLANTLFFIRAALWTFPVILFGILAPAFRTAETILVCWIAGVSLSLAATCVAWRHLPWDRVMDAPIDWGWIRGGVKRCFPIWLGVIGDTAATYVDRFVVEHYLGLDYVGIVSFYGSFVIAIQSLLQSGVFSFSYPRLISHHRRGDEILFWQEVRRMTIYASLFAGVMAVGVGIAVPAFGNVFRRPEFANYAPTLWLMLFGGWLRSATESLYYVLYARHQDRIVWVSGFLMLIPAIGCNVVLVPLMGFHGIGYSAVTVGAVLGLWRLYCVAHFHPGNQNV